MIKKILLPLSLTLNVLFIGGLAIAVPKVISVADGFSAVLSDFMERRMDAIEASQVDRADIVFLGDSITHEGAWDEYFPGHIAVNRGIGGDTVEQVIERFHQVAKLTPSQLFVMVGINNLNEGNAVDAIVAQYATLFDRIDDSLEGTGVVIQSVLPTNDEWLFDVSLDDVNALNSFLSAEAERRGYRYIDVGTLFADEQGRLDPAYSNDGIHLSGDAYRLWADLLRPYVDTVEAVDAIAPTPSQSVPSQ